MSIMPLCGHTAFSFIFAFYVTVVVFDYLNIGPSLQQAEPVFTKGVACSKIKQSQTLKLDLFCCILIQSL